MWTTSLFVLLAPEPGVGVGDLDGQLGCPLHDHLPVLGGDVVGDLSAVSPTGTETWSQVDEKVVTTSWTDVSAHCFCFHPKERRFSFLLCEMEQMLCTGSSSPP